VTTYALYLESGPQKKTTMVHVLELLGCVATGPTTDEALARTPDAIRAYLAYLQRHGAKVDPAAAFGVRVAEHATEGDIIGHGSSSVLYAPDRAPLSPADQRRYRDWLAWSRADLLALVMGRDAKALRAKPAGRGRSLEEILRHVLEADKDYVYSFLGPVKDVGEPANAALRGALDLREGLRQEREAAARQIGALTPADRRAIRKRGKSTRTARRMLRRMLEHEWEHRREIAERLGTSA
jgi:uncharacterized damage-inducible protein DinB/predicted RNase H-like HicB family nuclease